MHIKVIASEYMMLSLTRRVAIVSYKKRVEKGKKTVQRWFNSVLVAGGASYQFDLLVFVVRGLSLQQLLLQLLLRLLPLGSHNTHTHSQHCSNASFPTQKIYANIHTYGEIHSGTYTQTLVKRHTEDMHTHTPSSASWRGSFSSPCCSGTSSLAPCPLCLSSGPPP